MPAASCTLNAPQPKVPPVSSVTRAAMPAWRSTSSSDARCSAPRRSAGDAADQPGNARSAASTAARALARAAAAAALPPSARLLALVPGSPSAPIRCSVIGGPPSEWLRATSPPPRGTTGPVSPTPRATPTQSAHPVGSPRHFRRAPQGLVRLSLFVHAALSEGARLTPASREDGQPPATLGRQAEARPGGSSLLKNGRRGRGHLARLLAPPFASQFAAGQVAEGCVAGGPLHDGDQRRGESAGGQLAFVAGNPRGVGHAIEGERGLVEREPGDRRG